MYAGIDHLCTDMYHTRVEETSTEENCTSKEDYSGITPPERFTKTAHLLDVAQASSMGKALLFPILLVYTLPYLIIWKDYLSTAFFVEGYLDRYHLMVNLLFTAIIFLSGVVVHELLHGISWALFARKGWSSICFGIHRPGFIPYCHCREALPAWQYAIGALIPLLILGVFPVIYAWLIGNWIFLLFGTFFTVTAIGDVLVVYSLRHLSAHTFIADDPTVPGYHAWTVKRESV